MSSLYKDDGYLIVDHSASPGIPTELARSVGFDPKSCGEGKVMEVATLSCSHCRCCVVPNPHRVRERAYCQKCDHYICDLCAFAASQADYTHFPFAHRADVTLTLGEKGIVLGSPQELLSAAKLT